MRAEIGCPQINLQCDHQGYEGGLRERGESSRWEFGAALREIVYSSGGAARPREEVSDVGWRLGGVVGSVGGVRVVDMAD